MTALHAVSGQLGREVNPTIYSLDEWRSRVESGNSCVTRVLAQPRITGWKAPMASALENLAGPTRKEARTEIFRCIVTCGAVAMR